MIMTKAYVTELPADGSNIFKVSVPLMMDNTESDAIFDAILAHTPGIYKGIDVGDCVIVDFEDDKYDMAIILGKLFTEVKDDEMVYGTFNQLNVTGSAVLPEDTKIGKYTPQDFFNLYQGVDMKEGGGTGSLNPDDLKQYVQWTNTEREDETTQENVDIYADHIRVMTGEEYDAYRESEDFDEEEFNHTLYFLSSLSELDRE